MKARITIMQGEWESYIVNSVDDCKDDIDKSAYESFCKKGEVIQMGCVCVEPVVNNDSFSDIEMIFLHA